MATSAALEERVTEHIAHRWPVRVLEAGLLWDRRLRVDLETYAPGK